MYEIRDNCLKIIESYLYGRKQSVVYSEVQSDFQDIGSV